MSSKVRVADIPAWHTKRLLDKNSDPEEWVLWCEVLDGGIWRKFRDYDDIDAHIDDWMELGELAEKEVIHSIGFLPEFRLHRVGGGFSGVEPNHIDPLFHAVMAAGYATLNEIRTVYTLNDVYLMIDSITTTKRNEKLALDAVKAGNNG